MHYLSWSVFFNILWKIISRTKNISEEQFSKGGRFPLQKDLCISLMKSFWITRSDADSSISRICEVQNFTRTLNKVEHTGLHIRSAKSRTLKINDGFSLQGRSIIRVCGLWNGIKCSQAHLSIYSCSLSLFSLLFLVWQLFINLNLFANKKLNKKEIIQTLRQIRR